MTCIDGKKIAAEIRAELRDEVARFTRQSGKTVGLAVVLVGDDPASTVYVRNKIRACEEVGIRSFAYTLPADASQSAVEALVTELASDSAVDGILVQLPLPANLDGERILSLIPPAKDVDGFTAENLGRLVCGERGPVACTPLGVMELLRRSGIDPDGMHAVDVGRSNIVGTPMAVLMSRKSKHANCTVTMCHSRTKNLKEITLQADILIVAIGVPHFIKEDMVREGAVVIDVGIHRVPSETAKSGWKLIGDVDYDHVAPKCSYITPVPGGVGPMTIVSLLKNTLLACQKRG